MKPVRFKLYFQVERHRERAAVVNYRVYSEPEGVSTNDQPRERNFRSIDALLAGIAEAMLPADELDAIRAALEAGESRVCDVSEDQAEAVRLGFRD